jgi:hypothetical protein
MPTLASRFRGNQCLATERALVSLTRFRMSVSKTSVSAAASVRCIEQTYANKKDNNAVTLSPFLSQCSN